MGEELMRRGITTIFLVLLISLHLPMATQADEYDLRDDIIKATEKWGEYYHICPEFLQAIICKESSGIQLAHNGSCIGLMQINTKYHEAPTEEESLWDVDTNIHVGAEYLAELFERYEDIGLVLDLYNGNSKAFSNYRQGKLSPYASWILTKSEELEREHETSP